MEGGRWKEGGLRMEKRQKDIGGARWAEDEERRPETQETRPRTDTLTGCLLGPVWLQPGPASWLTEGG